MKFSCQYMPGGVVMCYSFPIQWELNLALHEGTKGYQAGYWEVMILAPVVDEVDRTNGRVKSVYLEWQTWQDVANIYEQVKRGDRSVLERMTPPVPSEWALQEYDK